MIIWDFQSVSLSGSTAAAVPALAGTVEADEVVAFADAAAGVTGELQTRVVRVAAGTLDFYVRIRSLAGLPLSAVEYRMKHTPTFPPLTTPIRTDVDYRPDGLGDLGPDSAVRSSVHSLMQPEIDYIGVRFGFNAGLQPGQTSRFAYLSTNATDYSRYPCQYLFGEYSATGQPSWQATANVFAPGHDTPAAGIRAEGRHHRH